MDIQVYTNNILVWRNRVFRCALGRSGVQAVKTEGDGATPIGDFALRRVLYRPDRLDLPKTRLPVAPLTPRDGWCDDPDHAAYNQPVTRPFKPRHEALWRSDNRYDIIVVLGHNDSPPLPNAGSAIFFHVAGDGFPATEGCIAIPAQDLLEILSTCGDTDRLCVQPGPHPAQTASL